MEPHPSSSQDLPKPQSTIPSPQETKTIVTPVTDISKTEDSLSDMETSPTISISVYVLAAAIVVSVIFFIHLAAKEISGYFNSGVFIQDLDSYLSQPTSRSAPTNNSTLLTNEEAARNLNAIGWSALEAGDLDKAETALLEAIRFDPTSALPYNNLGIVYHRQGDLEQAKLYYEKAIVVDPVYPKPVHNIASIYKDQGEYALAVKYYTKAIDIDSSWASPYEEMGEIYMYQGRTKKGLDSYRQAVSLGGPNSAVLEQILQNFVDTDEIDLSFDIVPPDNMIRIQSHNSGPGEGLPITQAHPVYGERKSTELENTQTTQPKYERTFYVDITDNKYVGVKTHDELFGVQGGQEAMGYTFYGLPGDATISEEERKRLIINGLLATYIRYSSPNKPDWYGEAVVIETDRYEYFIHNGGKKDDRFKEFYESFRYELGPQPVDISNLSELQAISHTDGATLKLFADRMPTDQLTELTSNEAGCFAPEIGLTDLILEYKTQQFELKSFGVPKQRNNTWQTTKHLVNVGLIDKEYDFVWSPVIRLGEKTFLVPNYNTMTAANYSERGKFYCDYKFTYEAFYLIDGILIKDNRSKSPYSINSLIFNLEQNKEIKPFCFDGCG